MFSPRTFRRVSLILLLILLATSITAFYEVDKWAMSSLNVRKVELIQVDDADLTRQLAKIRLWALRR